MLGKLCSCTMVCMLQNDQHFRHPHSFHHFHHYHLCHHCHNIAISLPMHYLDCEPFIVRDPLAYFRTPTPSTRQGAQSSQYAMIFLNQPINSEEKKAKGEGCVEQ